MGTSFADRMHRAKQRLRTEALARVASYAVIDDRLQDPHRIMSDGHANYQDANLALSKHLDDYFRENPGETQHEFKIIALDAAGAVVDLP